MAGTDLPSFALGVPFIELSIQRGGPPAFAVFATGNDVVRPKRLVRNRAAKLAVESGDIEIEADRPARERLGDDETGQGLCEHHKSSAASRSARSEGNIARSRSSRSHSRRRPSLTRGCGYSFPTRAMKASTFDSPQ